MHTTPILIEIIASKVHLNDVPCTYMLVSTLYKVGGIGVLSHSAPRSDLGLREKVTQRPCRKFVFVKSS